MQVIYTVRKRGSYSLSLANTMNLYHHKTDGGAEYLMDTFVLCPDGSKEGTITEKTRYIVRVDGDITKDAELTDRDNPNN